jgi:hypothetical protein
MHAFMATLIKRIVLRNASKPTLVILEKSMTIADGIATIAAIEMTTQAS